MKVLESQSLKILVWILKQKLKASKIDKIQEYKEIALFKISRISQNFRDLFLFPTYLNFQ